MVDMQKCGQFGRTTWLFADICNIRIAENGERDAKMHIFL